MRLKRNALSSFKGFVFCITLLPTLHAQTTDSASSSTQPNFVIILADDLGYGDIGAYRKLNGGVDNKPEAYKYTPNMDRLANEGVMFSRAYATGWCAPSRQVLLSGMWVGRKSATEQPWLGNRFRKMGYTTGLVGKVHGKYPIERCYDNTNPVSAEFDDGLFFNGGARPSYMKKGEVLPMRRALKPSEYIAGEGEYITDLFTDHAVDFIKRNQNNPFMLYIAHTAPHSPLQGKPEDMRKLFPDRFGSMSDEEIRKSATKKSNDALMADHYTGMVYGLDRNIGRVMETLRAFEIADNTVVIIVSDNGAIEGSNYPLDGHKWDGLEGGIRVPMIIWSKEFMESEASGSVCDRMVSLADVVPTTLAAAGSTEKLQTDGMNLIPHLTGGKPWPEHRRYLITNSCYTFQNTGAMDFGFEYNNGQQLMQCVYITDESKIISWNPNKTKNIGVVYKELPNITSKGSFNILIKEETPKDGVVPKSGPGLNLFNEMIGVIINSDGDVLQTWSCATPKELANYKWWWE
ncbi:MAG: sulfatase-like hydrolase/transferase [Saonia sp.]